MFRFTDGRLAFSRRYTDWMLSEEISGTKTYENDIASDSGLLLDAVNLEMTGNVSIAVYENGQLKTQDTDSSGYAQVMY